MRVAQEHDVVIDVRPTTPEAPRLLAEGNLPKPEAIKAKSINEADTYLGFRAADKGLVGYKMPEHPNLETVPAHLKGAVMDRYNQRMQEFHDLGLAMTDLQRPPGMRALDDHGLHQRITVDEHGVVHTETASGKKVGFTGDHDIFQIRDAKTGNPVSGERYNDVVAKLRSAGIGVEHGAHLNWEVPPAHVGVFDDVVAKHTPPGEAKGKKVGGEPLVSFGPEGPSRRFGPPPGEDLRAQARAAGAADKAAPNAPKHEPFQPHDSGPLLTPHEIDAFTQGIRPHGGEPPGAAPPRTPTGPVPTEPTVARSAATAVHDQLPEHTVMMDPNPKDAAGTHQMYENCLTDSPHREAAIYRNSETGEYIIVQGGEQSTSVGVGRSGRPEAPLEGGNPQRWKEILDGGDVGRWELVRHSHPADKVLPSGERVTPPADRFPSGRGGDMAIAEGQARASGKAVTQEIDITTERGREVVSYGFDPAQERPYHVTYPGEGGAPQTQRFKSFEAYGEWYENKFGRSPDLEPPSSPTPGRGTDTAPRAPGREGPVPEEGGPGARPAETGTPPTPEQRAVEQRSAEVKAIENEIAGIAERRQVAGTREASERAGLVREAQAKKAQADALERQARAVSDPVRRAEFEKQAAGAREAWESARDRVVANQEEVNALNRERAEAEARLDASRENLKLAEAGRRLSDTSAVTKRLEAHVDEAAAKFERGEIGMSPAQAKAAAASKGGGAKERGTVIDGAAKKAIIADAELEGLKATPQGAFGPDIYDPLTGRWWDITTPEDWAGGGHQAKYEGKQLTLPDGKVITLGKGTLLQTRAPVAP
jgi:hypothetical protein